MKPMVPLWMVVSFHYMSGPSFSEQKDKKNVDGEEFGPKRDIDILAKNFIKTEKELGQLVKTEQRKREEKERKGFF